MSGKSLRAKAPGRFYALLCSTILLFQATGVFRGMLIPNPIGLHRITSSG